MSTVRLKQNGKYTIDLIFSDEESEVGCQPLSVLEAVRLANGLNVMAEAMMEALEGEVLNATPKEEGQEEG